MSTYSFVAGSTLTGFNPATDVLAFTGYDAANLIFTQSGNDLVIANAGQQMVLSNVTYAQLASSSLSFANGSLFLPGTVGPDSLNGGNGNDLVDISAGGSDSVAGGGGNDVIHVGNELDAGDQIDGGIGTDELRLSGDLTLALGSTTLTSVERIVVKSGSVNLTLNDGNYTGLNQQLDINATSLDAGHYLYVDASLVTTATPYQGSTRIYGGAGDDSLVSGAGNDTLTGGDGADTLAGNGGNDSLAGGAGYDSLVGGDGNDSLLGDAGNDTLSGGNQNDNLLGGDGNDLMSGGDGNDTLTGGHDADTLTGGAGDDVFAFNLDIPRTDTSPSTIDTVTDFAQGDRIDLPGVNGFNGLSLVFNYGQLDFNPTNNQDFAAGNLGVQTGSNNGDGFADVFWRYNTLNQRIELWADANDDGQFSEVDIVTFLNTSASGKTALDFSDFVDNFVAWRGTDGNDLYTGNTLGNNAYALGGNDTLNGGLGNDFLYGGSGNDLVNGEADNDYLYGGSGSDILYGGDGSDSLNAQGNNTPTSSGTDAAGTLNYLYGEAGNDALYGGDGDDWLDGGADNDNLNGSNGNDTLLGGDGNDTLDGGVGSDSLDGGAGNDKLYVGNTAYPHGSATDTLVGGSGDDELYVSTDSSGDRAVLTGGAGADRFVLGYASATAYDTSFDNYYALTGGYKLVSPVSAPDRITDFNAAEGDAEGDLLRSGITNGLGNNNTPMVWMGQANAGFTATSGESLALAGSLDARFFGLWTFYDAGTETTVLYMDRNRDGFVDANDFKLEFSGNVALSQASFTAGTFTLKAGTAGDDTDTTPPLTNGADLAYALAGNDSLNGLDGNDTLNGDDGSDSLSGGLGNDHLYGGRDDDLLQGDAGTDVLYGGGGSDTLYGGDDADNLSAQGQRDALGSGYDYDAAGTLNWLYGEAGNDYLAGGDGDDWLDGGADNDYLSGNNGNDTLLGGDGNDTLDGGVGSDSLDGGAGNDELYVNGWGTAHGSATDTLVGGSGDDELYVGIGWSTDRAVMTGGTGADRFVLTNVAYDTQSDNYNYWTSTGNSVSPVSAPDRITDFNAAEGDAEGDLLRSGITNGLGYGSVPMVWRGDARSTPFTTYGGAANFTASLGEAVGGMDLGRGTFQLWTFYDAGSDTTVLYMDRNRDGFVDANDFKLEFSGNAALGQASFTAGTFKLTPSTTGTGGDDTLTGGVAAEMVMGGAGNDSLSGLDGNDILYGGAGNDTLDGGLLADTLFGGADNDSLLGGSGADYLYGGSGADSLDGGDGNDYLYADSNEDFQGNTVYDAAGTINVLHGGLDNDYVYGGNGNDQLFGDAGNDYITGGGGNDSIDGGGNVDTIYGGNGDDRIDYDGLDSVISGDAGIDLLVVHPGTIDLANIHLGNASDQTSGDNAVVTGFEGVDLSFLTTAITFSGDNNANYLIGTAYDDTLFGLGGNDTLDGGLGADTLAGGLGNDVFYVDNAGDVANEGVGEGTDEIRSTIDIASLVGNVENLTLLGSANLNGTGNTLANVLTGNSGNNQLSGGDGNDTLTGGGGYDTLSGGLGDDTYVVDDSHYVTLENPGEGTDLVQASVDWTLAANFENLTLTGSANLNGTGNALANILTGNTGNNLLDGGDGNDSIVGGNGDDTLIGGLGLDTLVGGTGNDTYMVDSASDVVTENYGAGTDTVQASVTYSIASYSYVENLTLTGTGNINATGNSNANVLTGNSGNNLLDGGIGIDTLIGGLGDDTYVVDNVGDVVTENAGEGSDTVQSSVSFTLGANLENLTLTGGSTTSGMGNALDNVILGNTGSNTLSGGDGNDSLSGNSGNDSILGGNGNDTLSGGTGTDTLLGGAGADDFVDTAANLNGDWLTDFASQDLLNVTGLRFSSLSYNATTGILGLDTDNNGTYETLLHMATGLNGVFRAQASDAGQPASTDIWYVPDTDGDGIVDDQDNAINVPNPDQRDTDGDGYGNIIDADINQDMVVDFFDLSMLDGVFGTGDANADFNGDGSVDFFDLSILDGLFGGAPGGSYVDGVHSMNAITNVASQLAEQAYAEMTSGQTEAQAQSSAELVLS